jgi:hypothetical protein
MLFLFAFLLLNPAIESVEVKLNTQDFINELVPEKQTQCANLLVMASLTNLYIFSKDGSLLQTLGGAGNGPGQFQRIGIVNRVHDSNSQPAIAVTDSRRLDITFYRYAGEGSGFTYVGRFNKAVRNIFPTRNSPTTFCASWYFLRIRWRSLPRRSTRKLTLGNQRFLPFIRSRKRLN